MTEKPVFKGLKIKVDAQKALDLIKDYLNSFGWTNFKFKKLERTKLYMVPFYLFHFDVFKTINKDGKEEVFDQTSGVLSLDSTKNKFDAQIARFFGLHEPVEKIDLKENSLEYTLLESNISDEKAEEIIKVKLASKFNVSRDNVIVSGKKLIFVPVYYSEIELNEETFIIKVNAFDGKIFSSKSIPSKKKELTQLVGETINDLKQPNKWADYSMSSFSNLIHLNSTVLFQFIVLVLVLIIIFLFLF